MGCEEKLAKQTERMTGEGEKNQENMDSSKSNGGGGVQGSDKDSNMLNAVDKSI